MKKGYYLFNKFLVYLFFWLIVLGVHLHTFYFSVQFITFSK
jgi:hypothetical protein